MIKLLKTRPLTLSAADIRRFWSKVDTGQDGGCWLWTGAADSKGYGVFTIRDANSTSGWRNVKSNRAAWVAYNTEIPEGLSVLHHCDNPSCVNPAHLFLGTEKDNRQDQIGKGRFTLRKFDEQQIQRMHEMRALGMTFKEIGREFGVPKGTIHRITSGRHYPESALRLVKGKAS
jgi:hypothetical protein